MPLNVVIAGAGIAGLSSAIALRRAGHVVSLYEQSKLNNELGAAINVPPNASRILLGWGIDPVEAKFDKVRKISMEVPFTMEPVFQIPVGDMVTKAYGAPFYFAHRVELHNALKSLAIAEGAKVHLGLRAVTYDSEKPSVTLSNGQIVEGDLVVAADGIHSAAVETVLGQPNPARPQEHYNCCYRFLIPVEQLRSDPETRAFTEDREGKMRMWADNANRRRLVTYPCRKHGNYNARREVDSVQLSLATRTNSHADWQASANHGKMMNIFEGFHPDLLRVIGKAADVKRWPLLQRDPIPKWTKGRLVLVGDAAHPMLPHQGQGGAQAIEDSAALGVALSGATKSDIVDRLAVFEATRRNRASAVQIFSNVGQDQVGLIQDQVAQYIEAEHSIPKNPQEFTDFNFRHDVVREAERRMKGRFPDFALPTAFFQREGPFA